ncbi:MAG: diguanylate cyclase [bacterium]|nr:MAG: diguanylate cyclase [bacterium]
MRRILVLTIAVAWTALCLVVYRQVVLMDEEDARRLALAQARALFQQVVDARSWNASYGGVYVKVDDRTRPNPYLDVPDRDLVTTDGQELTLINPAYMTRQLAEIGRRKRGVIIRITSLKPLRPGNEPLPWEESALASFEKGSAYMADHTTDENGTSLFRYMEPLRVDGTCLKCHSRQGYAEGDIRGGISVTFPVQDLIQSHADFRSQTKAAFGVIWLLGLAVLGSLTMYFTEKSRQVEEFKNLALVDELTGLNNRRAFFALTRQQMEWAERFTEKALLLFIDLDGMKQINDRFGHDEGDNALVLTAEALLSSFRGSDIVARYGGDEFVVFLPKSSLSNRDLIHPRVTGNVDGKNTLIKGDYTLSVSIGFAEFDPVAPMSLETLIREADKDMYGEKETEGKD